MEHLTEVSTHLNEVGRVLKGGGLYLFETPNLLVSRFWERAKGHSFSLQKIYHPSVQSYWSLNRKFKENGFTLRLIKMPFMDADATEKIVNAFGSAGKVFQHVDWDKWPIWLYPMFYGVAEKG